MKMRTVYEDDNDYDHAFFHWATHLDHGVITASIFIIKYHNFKTYE